MYYEESLTIVQGMLAQFSWKQPQV